MPPRPKVPTFAAVVSRFNLEFTEGLLTNAQEVLADYPLKVVWVPGAFEIPLEVQRLARSKKYAAVLAFGLVWKGKTLHAQEILRAVTDSLMRITLETDVPVIHEVLSVSTEREARDRCLKKKLNRGREGAEAALHVLGLTVPKKEIEVVEEKVVAKPESPAGEV